MAQEVVTANVPIVALESTVIAQGLPWPENLETALEMEAGDPPCGAIPATIAILDGVPRIGLSPAEIERVARSAAPASRVNGTEAAPWETRASPRWVKANRRDLSVVAGAKRLCCDDGLGNLVAGAACWIASPA